MTIKPVKVGHNPIRFLIHDDSHIINFSRMSVRSICRKVARFMAASFVINMLSIFFFVFFVFFNQVVYSERALLRI